MTLGSLRTSDGRAVGDLGAVVEHDDMIGDLHDDGHVVLDQQDRRLVLVADHVEQRVELERLAGVEAGGGFVEAEHHRVGAHRAGDLETALRAIGQFAGGIVGALGEADLLQPVFGALDRLALGGAIAGKAEHAEERHAAGDHQAVVVRDHQVFEHGHALKQPDVLEGARDFGPPGDVVAGHALEQIDIALVRLGAALARQASAPRLRPDRRCPRGQARGGLRSACRSR